MYTIYLYHGYASFCKIDIKFEIKKLPYIGNASLLYKGVPTSILF